MTAAPSSTTDRECTPLRVCDYPASEYENVSPSADGDRGCSALTVCDGDTEFESVPSTPTSDRNCSNLTVCDYPATEYEITAPNATSDRQCAPLSACDANAGVVVSAATATSDRACECVGEYWGDGVTCAEWATCSEEEYITAPPSNTVDRECTPLTVCLHATEIVSATNTTDRVCLCDTGYFMNGTSCLPWTECTPELQIEVAAPNATTDRICEDLPAPEPEPEPPVMIEATTTITGVISTEQFIRALRSRTGGNVTVTEVKQKVATAATIPGDADTWQSDSNIQNQFKAGVAATFGVDPSNVTITSISSGERRRLAEQAQIARRQAQAASVKVDYIVEANKDVSSVASQSETDFAATLTAALNQVIADTKATCEAVTLGVASTCSGTATDTTTTPDCAAAFAAAAPTTDASACAAGCTYAGTEASCALAGDGACAYTPASTAPAVVAESCASATESTFVTITASEMEVTKPEVETSIVYSIEVTYEDAEDAGGGADIVAQIMDDPTELLAALNDVIVADGGEALTSVATQAVLLDECEEWRLESLDCIACIAVAGSQDMCVSWGIDCDSYGSWLRECETPEPEPEPVPTLEAPEQPSQQVAPEDEERTIDSAPTWLKVLGLSASILVVGCCVAIVGILCCQRRRAQKQRIYSAGREAPPLPGKSAKDSSPDPPPPPATPALALGPSRTPGSRPSSAAMVGVPGTSDRYGDLALTPAQPWRRSSPSPTRTGGRVGMPPPVTYVAKPTSPLGAPVPVRQTMARPGTLPALEGRPRLPSGSQSRPRSGRQSEALLRITCVPHLSFD